MIEKKWKEKYEPALFSMHLMEELSNETNEVISPLGIKIALGILAYGVKGKGMEEMMRALQSPDAKSLLDSLSDEVLADEEYGLNHSSTIITGKLKDGVEWNKEFLELAEEIYHVQVNTERVMDSTSVEIENTITFDGKWKYKMKKKEKGWRDFQNADHTIGHPEFATVDQYLPYDKEMNYEAVILPYGENTPYQMIFVKPTNYLTKIELKTLETILRHARKTDISVAFPMFQFDRHWDLKAILKKYGMKELFSPTTLDIPSVVNRLLYVSEITQNAKIEVTESGTKAEAITKLDMCLSLGCVNTRVVERKCFIADKPFYYFLRNEKTGEILFEGKINQL